MSEKENTKKKSKTAIIGKILAVCAIILLLALFIISQSKPWLYGVNNYTPSEWELLIEGDVADGTYYVYGNVTFNGVVGGAGRITLNDTTNITYAIGDSNTETGKDWNDVVEGEMYHFKAKIIDSEVSYVDYFKE